MKQFLSALVVLVAAIPWARAQGNYEFQVYLNLSPGWEFNLGVGIGPTAATDHWIVKAIVGRRFNWKGRK